jgi:putative two-component system response regulator
MEQKEDRVRYQGNAGSYRVLVVDDEEVVRLVLGELLQPEFLLALLPDAESVVPFLLHAPPHVIVLDKNLPGFSGLELLQQVKALSPLTEVIIITGYASLDSALEALRLGAYDYLLKPFDNLDIVMEKVRRAAEKAELAHERQSLLDQVLASNRELQLAHEMLKRSYLQTLSSMISALEARDAYTRGHSDRVAALSEKLGRAMGYQNEKLNTLVDAARLHDLGKIGIREQVLNKKSRLTDQEYEHIKRHPDIGADIVAHIEAYQQLVPIIRHHHERFDGLGYPQKLRGEQIPHAARIIAVADTYDAITSTRPYRQPRSPGEALKVIREEAGRQFDPQIAAVFLRLFQ